MNLYAFIHSLIAMDRMHPVCAKRRWEIDLNARGKTLKSEAGNE